MGIAVQSAMFRKRIRTKDLAVALGVTPSVAGKKLRGAIAWSVQDLFAAGQMLQVDPEYLLPQRNSGNPGQVPWTGIPDLVSGAGFEPVQVPWCPQRGSNPRPMD
ncbi:MAG: XRE family transcriptional regulator [Propionibacterium sp.]|nr:XRE family transcriptional regulator [Propionibacterium sp.]